MLDSTLPPSTLSEIQNKRKERGNGSSQPVGHDPRGGRHGFRESHELLSREQINYTQRSARYSFSTDFAHYDGNQVSLKEESRSLEVDEEQQNLTNMKSFWMARKTIQLF